MNVSVNPRPVSERLDVSFTDPRPAPGAANRALVYAVESDRANAATLMTVIDGSRAKCEIFSNSVGLINAMSRAAPDMIFLDVSTDGTDAVETLHALSQCAYPGVLQLMSNPGVLMVEPLRQLARLQSLQVLPPLLKPLEISALKKAVRDLGTTVSQAPLPQFHLEEAIHNGWVQFWYQPKISLRNKTLVGMETFVRVFHPHKGLVPPSTVLRNADERALITLAHHALTETGVASARLSELGLNPTIAVNVTLKGLRTLPVARIFRDYIAKTSRQPQWIFDVSEEDIANNSSSIKDLDAVFRSIGIKLAVDNFTGKLLPQTALRELPITEIKLSPAAVAHCATRPDEAASCKALIDMAHQLQATAVAIGVETVAQSMALQQLGCDVGQGFLFGHPLPLEQIINIIRQRSVAAKPAARAR
jgi:EAL domain-containing protein (putative c-di-GMP-specific phosphodiesterase class I)/CheY-like chemotaxis protein